MIECPRCGFLQPKDQYCARCGVDMVAFRPAPPPLFKRVSTHPLVFLSFVFVLVFVSILLIRKQRTREMADRIQFLQGGGPVVFSTKENWQSSQTESTAEPFEEEEASQRDPASELPALPQAQTRAKEALPASAPEQTPLQLDVHYVDISKVAAERMRQESQALNLYFDLGDIKGGAVNELSKRLKEKQGFVFLDSQKKSFEKENTQQWFVGRKGTDQLEELGFLTLVAIEPTETGSIRGEIELARLLRESPNTPAVRKAYPVSSFEVSKTQGWVIFVNLPTVAQENSPLPELLPSALGIYRSASFPKASEFAIFFDFHH